MNRIGDSFTAFVSRAGDILFVQNPKGTSVGAFCGIFADGVLKFFSPALSRFREWIAPERINVFYMVATGIFIFNVPSLLRRRQLPNSVEDAFEAIRRMKREGAPAVQIKIQLLALCSSVVEQAKVDFEKLDRKSRPSRLSRERF